MPQMELGKQKLAARITSDGAKKNTPTRPGQKTGIQKIVVTKGGTGSWLVPIPTVIVNELPAVPPASQTVPGFRPSTAWRSGCGHNRWDGRKRGSPRSALAASCGTRQGGLPPGQSRPAGGQHSTQICLPLFPACEFRYS